MSLLNNPNLKSFQRDIVIDGLKKLKSERGYLWSLSGILYSCFFCGILGYEFVYGFPEKFTNLVNFLIWFYVVVGVLMFVVGFMSMAFLGILYSVKSVKAEEGKTEDIVNYHEYMLSLLYTESMLWYVIVTRTIGILDILFLAGLGWTFWAVILALSTIVFYIANLCMKSAISSYFLNLTEETVEKLK